MRAKHAWETIKMLELNNGEVIEDEDLILLEIHRFYSELFKSDLLVVGRVDKRDQALNLITRKITAM